MELTKIIVFAKEIFEIITNCNYSYGTSQHMMLYRNYQGIKSIAIATFARECGII